MFECGSFVVRRRCGTDGAQQEAVAGYDDDDTRTRTHGKETNVDGDVAVQIAMDCEGVERRRLGGSEALPSLIAQAGFKLRGWCW